jgi:N-acetylneuraminic acid mutarotase
MIFKRQEFGLVCSPDGRHLYAIGGFNEESHCLASVERYSFENDSWELLAELDRPLKALGAVALPDGVYAIGGFDGYEQRYTELVRKFDGTGWQHVNSMNVARGAFTAIALSTCDYVYAIGGFG